MGLLVFAAICDALIIVAGGGISFLRCPVGIAYLVLWSVWWVAIALGRQRGVASRHDRGQRGILILGIVALGGLIVGPPWEYTHGSGPLPRDGLLAWVGLGLLAAGIGLQLVTFLALSGLYTSRLGIQPGHHLVTSGPYRWVRHPGYLSNLVCMVGIGFALGSLIGLALALAVVPLIVRRIGAEEAMLREEFDQEYQRYRQQTRWRLVPLLY